jgi:Tfp pilus assembly protein PilZ
MGACLWTNGAFAVGESLVMRLSFPREAQPIQAAGRVVWEDPKRDERGALRLGLRWSHNTGPAHMRLKQLIDSSL